MPGADDKKDKQPAASKSTKQKRQLKAAPVTVREQSEQAQVKAARPTKRGRLSHILIAPFRGLVWLFKPLGRFKPFRILGYIIVPPYLRNAFAELRLVSWPSAKQTRQLTFAVIVFSLIFGAVAAVLDWGLDKIFRAVILK